MHTPESVIAYYQQQMEDFAAKLEADPSEENHNGYWYHRNQLEEYQAYPDEAAREAWYLNAAAALK